MLTGGNDSLLNDLADSHFFINFFSAPVLIAPLTQGLPGGSAVKNLPAMPENCRKWGLDPWVAETSWSRAWQPTLVFLPGECHGQRTLVGYSP